MATCNECFSENTIIQFTCGILCNAKQCIRQRKQYAYLMRTRMGWREQEQKKKNKENPKIVAKISKYVMFWMHLDGWINEWKNYKYKYKYNTIEK